ncbi:MAG: hypothetical protein WBL93_13655 [Lutisporaceae bacterium]
MKKIFIILTILSILLISTIGVSADSESKDIEVVLSDMPTVVNVGETIALTATTQKHGSSYFDSWNNAVKSHTEFESETETYISEAYFLAEEPGIYNVSYTISMTAGESGTVFSNTVEKIIEVVDSVTLAGAVIKDLKVTPIYLEDGSISCYSAYISIYALWSDNTTTYNSSMYFFFEPDETSKHIDVILYIDGTPYTYTVTVDR